MRAFGLTTSLTPVMQKKEDSVSQFCILSKNMNNDFYFVFNAGAARNSILRFASNTTFVHYLRKWAQGKVKIGL